MTRRSEVSARSIERWSTGVVLGAMLVTPFVRAGSRSRRVLSTITVVAGAARTAAIECRVRGARRTVSGALGTVALSMAAEQVGSRTGYPFGRYRYTSALQPRLASVPVVVPLAWYAMGVPSTDVGRALGERRPIPSTLLGATAMTAWDLFLDPQMTAEGYWTWQRDARYEGIPASNFAGWFAASLGIVTVITTSRADHRCKAPNAGVCCDEWCDHRCQASNVGSHVWTYAAVAVLETVVFATFFRNRRVALVGGAAMLPLAVLSLARVVGPRS